MADLYLHSIPHDEHMPPLCVEVQLCAGGVVFRNHRGDACLTSRCATPEEVHSHFDGLIKKIQRQKRKALQIFSNARRARR